MRRQTRQTQGKVTWGIKGFTLLEVLVSMVLFAVAALGLAQLQVGTIQANAQAKRRSVATNFAQDMVEKVRDGQGCVGTSMQEGGLTYNLECAVSSGPDNTQNIIVTVSWEDYTSQSVVLRTRY